MASTAEPYNPTLIMPAEVCRRFKLDAASHPVCRSKLSWVEPRGLRRENKSKGSPIGLGQLAQVRVSSQYTKAEGLISGQDHIQASFNQ